MENVYICNAMFLDSRTIQLFEEYPVSEKEIRLIILPGTIPNKKRKAGLMKGKIRLSEDFNETLEEMKEYME